MIEDGVSTTVWIRRKNGKYDGSLVENNANFIELGTILLEKFKTLQDAERLLKNVFIKQVTEDGSVIPSTQTERQDGEEADMLRDVGESVATMTSNRHCGGSYTYVFDEANGVWWVGLEKDDTTLQRVIDMINR